jgi:hypothetical protein
MPPACQPHRYRRNDYGTQIWQLLNFELWHRWYVDASPAEKQSRLISTGPERWSWQTLLLGDAPLLRCFAGHLIGIPRK